MQDLEYQQRMLPCVSRTFALTVPRLPDPLDDIVANAYLLCRIADSVEDDPWLDDRVRRELHDLLPEVVDQPAAATRFAHLAAGSLSEATPADERDLASNTERVARIARGFTAADRRAVVGCLREMCYGMQQYRNRAGGGLNDLADMELYCHYVAGVVGEMLTELFCNHDPEIAAVREPLRAHADAFGLGLQMTNILKDVWDDLEEQRCWLPRREFERAGYDFTALSPGHDRETFDAVIRELVAVAHGYLRQALEYTLWIPPRQAGIRRFCLWSIGLALMTLRRICETPGFDSGEAVKVSRRTVTLVMASTELAGHVNLGTRALFGWWARSLPVASSLTAGASRSVSTNQG